MSAALTILVAESQVSAQQIPTDGPGLYRLACANCHGADGSGVDPENVALLSRRQTLPTVASLRASPMAIGSLLHTNADRSELSTKPCPPSAMHFPSNNFNSS